MSKWWLYMIRCGDNSLYTGISTDVDKRFKQHLFDNSRKSKYLRGREPLTLILKKEIGIRSTALKLEKQIKKLTKKEKEALVNGNDLLEDIIQQIGQQAIQVSKTAEETS